MDSQASVDLVKTKLSNLYKLRNSAILNVPSSSTSQTKKKTDKVDTVYMSSLAKDENATKSTKPARRIAATLRLDDDSDELAYICFQSDKKKPKKRSRILSTEEKESKSRMKILQNRSLLDSVSPVVESRENESIDIISTTGRKLQSHKKAAGKVSKAKKNLFN